MKCALLQLNPVIGDIAGNAAAIAAAARRASAAGARLCVTPELALIGCPPRDLLLYDAVVTEAGTALEALTRELADGPAVVLGTAARRNPRSGGPLFNRAVLLDKGRIAAVYDKRVLPCDDVFDESRYFEPGSSPVVVELDGLRLALSVGEDIGNGRTSWSRPGHPSEPAAGSGAFDVLINLSASPFTTGKPALRERMLADLARRHGAHVLYANQAGGNDELVFDGHSLCAAPDGSIIARGRGFTEDLALADLAEPAAAVPGPGNCPEEEIWDALVLGLRDFMLKTGFRRAVLGLSGGVDSALVAAVAVAAAGSENVTGLLMPSPWSSDHSVADALELARNLGLRTHTVPLEPALRALESMLDAQFAGLAPDTTEENIQARVRGLLLMAHSNKFGAMLLNTGNKSELSVGYCTLYGDMCGALAVIGDVSKTEVYNICRWYNGRYPRGIPENILRKPPSAELRPGQTDQDSLPPYDELDPILELLIGRRLPVAEIVRAGHEEAVVRKVAGLVARSEFKRRQAPPLIRISPYSFGSGRRMPVAGVHPYR